MSRRILQFPILFCALTAPFAAQARNVFVTPPGDGVARPVLPFTGDPFAPASTSITAAQDTFQVISTPSGNKYYFIGRSGADTVVVTDSNYQVIARRGIGTGATAAAMTPDGRYLVVATGANGNVQIMRTADDNIATQVDGAGAIDVAISRDGQRAFVVNAAGRLTAIDLNSFAQAGTQALTGGITGIAVGPNGLVYVAGTNVLYEMEYSSATSSFSIRQNAAIGLNGIPGKPVIVAEGVSGLRAVMVNQIQFPGAATLFNIDLNSRVLNNIVSTGLVLDRIVPVSFTRLFAISNSQQLYEVNFAANTITPANFTGVPGVGIRGLAVSNEFPTAKYLYLASSATNTLARIETASSTVAPLLPLTSLPGGLSFTGPSATGTPAKAYTFNNGQQVVPETLSVPLILRVVDASDRPLSSVPLQCAIRSGTGGQVVSASSTTDGEGYGQVVVRAPLTTGAFQVGCSAGSGVLIDALFNLVAGAISGPGGPSSSGTISVKSGNGQVMREQGTTAELLRVVVRDANNNPLPNVLVRWAVVPRDPNSASANIPIGTIASSETTTDSFGEATNSFIAPFLGAAFTSGFAQSTITAATANNQVNLYATAIPNQFFGNTVPLPTVIILKPATTDSITAPAGSAAVGAIQARIAVGAGAGGVTGTPIPNVSLNVTTGLDATAGPTASCAQDGGKGLSDASGIATCDVLVGGKTGTVPMTVTMANQTVGSLNLTVTFGLPGKIDNSTPGIGQGNNQTGPAGSQLPLALVAQVQDSFGNILSGAQVTWAVELGTATLVNPITRADTNGRVSTLVRLGAAPGPVRVRVTAVNGTPTATAVYELSITGGVVQLRTLSGDGQSTVVGQAFPQALVAQVVDGQGQPVPGVQVNWVIRGGQANLSPTTATSDAQGQVRTIATAGGVVGQVVVAAEFTGNSTTFTLLVRAQGPTFTSDGVTNSASGQRAIAPGSIVTIRGANIATNVRGYVLPQSPNGPLPTSLAGVTVQFGGVPAPIFWVANVNNFESVTVQVPFDTAENTSVPVTVTSSGASSSVNVQISPAAPGIFEDVDAQNRRYAVVARTDGTFVTPDNPIGKGERATVFVTGLGKTDAQSFTNAMGAGNQRPVADVVLAFGDGAGAIVNVEYARGLIGVYAVTFDVPANSASGALRINVAGGGVFGNQSTLYVR